MNHNATAPHRNAPPLYSRRRNMVTIRRRVHSTSIRVGVHPYRSHTRSETISLQTFTLPVVRMEVPSLNSFHLLYDYNFTKNMTILRQILSPPSVTQTIFNLNQQSELIRNLWKNACALSVVDIGLYIVMQDLYVEAQNAIRRIEMGSL